MFKTMLSADWRFLLDHDGWTVPQKNRTIFLKRRSLLFGYFFNRGCCGLIITFDMLSLNSRQCTNNVLKSIVHFSLSKSNKTFIYFSFFRFSPKSSDSNDDFSVSQSNSTIELPLDQSVSAIVLGQSAPSYAYSHFRSVKWPWARSEKENTRLSFYFFLFFNTRKKHKLLSFSKSTDHWGNARAALSYIDTDFSCPSRSASNGASSTTCTISCISFWQVLLFWCFAENCGEALKNWHFFYFALF